MSASMYDPATVRAMLVEAWPTAADVDFDDHDEWHWTHPTIDLRWSISRLGRAVFTTTYVACVNGAPLRTGKLKRERRFKTATAALYALRATIPPGALAAHPAPVAAPKVLCDPADNCPECAAGDDPADFTSAEDVLVWLSGFGGGSNEPSVEAVRNAIAFARADIADRLATARADVYESVSRERDEASAALLGEQDRTAALRSALARLIDAAVPHVGAEYPTDEETRALRIAIKNAREDMR